MYFYAAHQSLVLKNEEKMSPEVRVSFAPFSSHCKKPLPSRIFLAWSQVCSLCTFLQTRCHFSLTEGKTVENTSLGSALKIFSLSH